MIEATFVLLIIHLMINISILIKLFKMDRD